MPLPGFASLNPGYDTRHARARRGYPRLLDMRPTKDVDGRNKSGHDDVDASFLSRLLGEGQGGGLRHQGLRKRRYLLPPASLRSRPHPAHLRCATLPLQGRVKRALLRGWPLLQLVNPLLRLSLARRALLRVELGDEIV